jgi:hypothetical protein
MDKGTGGERSRIGGLKTMGTGIRPEVPAGKESGMSAKQSVVTAC